VRNGGRELDRVARIDESLLLVPETAEELDGLERSRLHLASLGCPLELWEILLLTQSGAWDPQRRTAPLPEGPPAPTPIQTLLRMRESEGRFVRDLRFFLERMAAPTQIACAEVVIGAIAASRRNRAAVLRWIADPAKHRPEAERRIASLAWRAGKLMEQVERRRALAWEASLRAEPAPPPPPAPRRSPRTAAESVPMLSSRMLADLRRAHRGSTVMRDHLFHRVEPWELVLMISAEGDRIREKIDSLLTGERTGEWIQLDDAALSLVGRAVGVRCEWGCRVKELQSYVRGLTGRPPEELAVGLEILLGAPAGRRRALRWLESPVDFAPEATLYMGTVLTIADRYRDDLDSDLTLVVTSRVA
jgi:hypothetical protein